MHTWNLVAPRAARLAWPSRATNADPPATVRDRRRHLLRALGGPANPAPSLRPPPPDRHGPAARPDAQRDHRCPSSRH
jgi:hypothetical protein